MKAIIYVNRTMRTSELSQPLLFINKGTEPREGYGIQKATQLLHSRARTLPLFTQFPVSLLPQQRALWVTASHGLGQNPHFRVMKARILSVDFTCNRAWLFLTRVYLRKILSSIYIELFKNSLWLDRAVPVRLYSQDSGGCVRKLTRLGSPWAINRG